MSVEISEMMRNLSTSMELVAAAMLDQCDGDSEWLLHAKEVLGASQLLQSWAIRIEQEMSE